MSRIGEFRRKVAAGHYELTGHAKDEMEQDAFTISDVKAAVYNGKIVGAQRHERRRRKYVIAGVAADRRPLRIVVRLTDSGRLRVVTVFAE